MHGMEDVDTVDADVEDADMLPHYVSIFSRLDTDAVQQVAAFLPIGSLLTLSAVSQEVARTFCPAVLSLAVSKVSLRGDASLPQALRALSKRYPLLSDLDLKESDATDAEVALVAESFRSLTKLNLQECDDVTDRALLRLGSLLPGLLSLGLLGCRVRKSVKNGITRPRRCGKMECFHTGSMAGLLGHWREHERTGTTQQKEDSYSSSHTIRTRAAKWRGPPPTPRSAIGESVREKSSSTRTRTSPLRPSSSSRHAALSATEPRLR